MGRIPEAKTLGEALELSSKLSRSYLWNRCRNDGAKLTYEQRQSIKRMRATVEQYLLNIYDKKRIVEVRKLSAKQMNADRKEKFNGPVSGRELPEN